MEDWKLRQLIFRKFGFKHDVISEFDNPVLTNDQLIAGIEQQFNDGDSITYPFKSYCVALVYAHNLVEMYGKDTVYYLNEDLLPDDPCFCRYDQAKDIYDYFLTTRSWLDSAMAKLIKQYWIEEYVSEIQYEHINI